jgi:undecaprenyl-diphosphatase
MVELITAIDSWDKAVVLYIQQQWQTPWLYAFFDFITHSRNWAYLLIPAWFWLLLKGGKRGRVVAILILPMFLLTDVVTAKLWKPLFGRPRPLGHGGFSFPSNHATNSFAIATIICYAGTKIWQRIGMFIIALAVAFSRVYLGVHYPTDVTAGALLGILDAMATWGLYLFLKDWLEQKMPRLFNHSPTD